MKLAEFLIQGQQLRQHDRTSTLAYFEQCLKNTTLEGFENDLVTTVRVLLDLSVELIATKQPDALQRAKTLLQEAGNVLNQDLEASNEQKAYWLYVQGILAIESEE